ncbi:hypothetical protein BSR29_06420 [Boudabousia liubingyangii]|uniref:Uncharacterized protein n=1 Tax=Boudabousia liubingyangii TaxID=1921764 RepID=A0A1Q5PKS9_9ACTO|nr:hypothetical protein [Boudabousia liubingyangii]OKL46428.1 hypothetical protein BSR28_07860 [Boudabousia liubingyangii]OKL47249.1 hypothetical protein BSR29_06420 [Boudabousia liubingyangii]
MSLDLVAQNSGLFRALRKVVFPLVLLVSILVGATIVYLKGSSALLAVSIGVAVNLLLFLLLYLQMYWIVKIPSNFAPVLLGTLLAKMLLVLILGAITIKLPSLGLKPALIIVIVGIILVLGAQLMILKKLNLQGIASHFSNPDNPTPDKE